MEWSLPGDSVSSRIFLRVSSFRPQLLTGSAPSTVFPAFKSRSFALKISEQIRSTHDQDGAVLLDIRQGQMFRLNPVASRMFGLLKLGYADARIADEISREFGMDRQIVEVDLSEFLRHLEAQGLLQSQIPESPDRL